MTAIQQQDNNSAEMAPEKWVDLYGDVLYRYAYSRTLNPAVAEDMVQETFLAALSSYTSFKGDSHFKTWLVGILKNKIIDHFRKISRESPALNLEDTPNPAEELFNKSGDWLRGPEQWQNNPYQQAEDKDFWNTIQSCLYTTPERLAHAFTLRELNDLSTEEICHIMGISSSNCWVLLHRARLIMKDCMSIKWFTR